MLCPIGLEATSQKPAQSLYQLPDTKCPPAPCQGRPLCSGSAALTTAPREDGGTLPCLQMGKLRHEGARTWRARARVFTLRAAQQADPQPGAWWAEPQGRLEAHRQGPPPTSPNPRRRKRPVRHQAADQQRAWRHWDVPVTWIGQTWCKEGDFPREFWQTVEGGKGIRRGGGEGR